MKDLESCPICGYDKIKQYPLQDPWAHFYECGRCGRYQASDMLMHFSDVGEKLREVGYILSGLTRELHETGGKPPSFTTENYEAFTKRFPVPDLNNIGEKIKKLLQRVRAKTQYFGEEVKLGDIETVVPLAYAKNPEELIALFTLMTEKKLAKIGILNNEKDDGERTVRMTLSANGWDLTNTLEDKNKESDRGFVAVWFDDSMNENINAAEEAITESGFRSICIRDEHFSERIMDKALGEIRSSRFVIVDLTGNRGSVFFEAGFAHGLGIETIYVYCEEHNGEITNLEFYVKHYQCYKYKTPSDLKETLKAAIAARIKVSK